MASRDLVLPKAETTALGCAPLAPEYGTHNRERANGKFEPDRCCLSV